MFGKFFYRYQHHLKDFMGKDYFIELNMLLSNESIQIWKIPCQVRDYEQDPCGDTSEIGK